MSDPSPNQPRNAAKDMSTADTEDAAEKGINLTLVYSLIALALVAAIGFALMIVLPFYHRR